MSRRVERRGKYHWINSLPTTYGSKTNCRTFHFSQLIWPITAGNTSIFTWSANEREAFIGSKIWKVFYEQSDLCLQNWLFIPDLFLKRSYLKIWTIEDFRKWPRLWGILSIFYTDTDIYSSLFIRWNYL